MGIVIEDLDLTIRGSSIRESRNTRFMKKLPFYRLRR